METTSTTGSLAGSAQTAEDRLTFSPSSVIMPGCGSTVLEGNRNGARPDPAQTLRDSPDPARASGRSGCRLAA